MNKLFEFFSSIVKGFALFGAFLFGRKTVQRDVEREARENAEGMADAWANRPRERRTIVRRLRKYAAKKD